MENILKKIDKQETTFELFQDIWWLFKGKQMIYIVE